MAEDIDSKIYEWRDIGYVCRASLSPYGASIQFKVVKIFGEECETKTLLFPKSNGSSDEPVESLAEADIYLSGGIKWDGCSNIMFDEQDRVMLHFCGRAQAKAIGELLARLYDVAVDFMPDSLHYLSEAE